MALGGMFDHLGGGFTRYATDSEWKIPHFEKMLYDNAQLMGIYAKAYRKFNDPLLPLYREKRRAKSLVNEFKDSKGGYFSSINAVSDEEEGGYYTWTAEEIEDLDQSDEIIKLFNITKEGNWENGQNVLFALEKDKKDYLQSMESGFRGKHAQKKKKT